MTLLHKPTVVALLILLLTYDISLVKANGGEHCQGSNGEYYFCDGFCCPSLGCCSYSSLWYAWVLLALIILMCICGWAGCGARRYYAVRRGSSYRQMVSYDSYSNEISTIPITRARNKHTTRQPRRYEATNKTSSTAAPNSSEPPPPAYTVVPSAPPPYSYY